MVGVIGQKRGKGLAGDHDGHSSALKLLLTQHDCHLRVVDVGSFGSSDGHHAEVVARKLLLETCQGFVYHF